MKALLERFDSVCWAALDRAATNLCTGVLIFAVLYFLSVIGIAYLDGRFAEVTQ